MLGTPFWEVALTSHPCYLFYICGWGTSRWPLVKVGQFMRDLPGSRTFCLMIIQGDLPGARTLCLMTTKKECLTPPGTQKIWQNVGDLRGKKASYIMPVPGRFLENMGTHIFFKKGVPHTTQQSSGLWKTGHLVWIFLWPLPQLCRRKGCFAAP